MKLHQVVRDIQVGVLVAAVLVIGGIVGGIFAGGAAAGALNSITGISGLSLVVGGVLALLIIGLGMVSAHRVAVILERSDEEEQAQDAEAIRSTHNIPVNAAAALAKAHYFGSAPAEGVVWGPVSSASKDGQSVTNYSLTYSNQNGYSVLTAKA